MLMMINNHEFCYWLQGYFEISNKITLDKEKILLIMDKLEKISRPLSEFNQWLYEVCLFLSEENYRPGLIEYFLPIIRDQLNLIFFHVIDNSYDTNISLEISQKIHDGER